MMVIQYALVHSLSLSATTNLFNLINNIFAKPIIPETRYIINKLFNPQHCATYHALCNSCGKNLGVYTHSDTFKKCDLCNIDINVKDSMYNNFFVSLDPSSQITDLLEANSDFYEEIVKSKKTLCSLFDGKLYRRFVESLPPDDKNRYASVVFNTDGAPLFESSTYSIWPIYLMLNELPFDVKVKNLIVVGLWFNKKKPEMNVFLEQFVKQMNTLGDVGVECSIKNKKQKIKIFCLVCCVDSVARAPMLGLILFYGKYGCLWCKNPTEWIANINKPNSGSTKYPWICINGLLRSEAESILHMKKGTAEKPCYGFKNPSVLINLTKFNIIDGTVPDDMHIVSGLVKQFSAVWFGNKKCASKVLIKAEIEEINKILNDTKAPHQVGRLTRSLEDREHWKARECFNWLLFYSAPIISSYLDEKLVNH